MSTLTLILIPILIFTVFILYFLFVISISINRIENINKNWFDKVSIRTNEEELPIYIENI